MRTLCHKLSFDLMYAVIIGVTLCQTVRVAMVVQRCPDEILGGR
jgi:hypothetical protein